MISLSNIDVYGILSNKRFVQHHLSLITLGVAAVALPISVKVCHAAIVLYLLNWLFEGNWREKFATIKTEIVLILIIVLFVMEVFGMFYTNATGLAAIEKKVFFVLVPVALATSQIKLTSSNINQVIYCFVVSCLVCSFVCLINASYQLTLLSQGTPLAILSYLDGSDFNTINGGGASHGWLSFSYISLANGIGIHPTYFSLYLAFAITFLLFGLSEGPAWRKLFSWVVIAYFSFFLMLLSSRIIIVGIFAFFVVAIFQSMRMKETVGRGLGLAIIVGLSATLLYLNPVSRYRNLQEIPFTSLHIQSNTNYMNSTEIRASLWWLGLKTSETVNPIWGTGTDDVYDDMKRVGDEYHITNSLDTYDPHNQFLFTLIGSGIIGLTLLVALIGSSLYFAFVRRDYFYATFIFLFSLLCITETALQLQKGIVFFAIFFSLLAFTKRPVVSVPTSLKPV